jgi:peptidoglycan/xylan/chitin deacetylase (PgdA/CDA1 family)
MTSKSVPVLITWDVDPGLWIPFDERKLVLNAAIDVCHSLNIRATFFFTAQPAYMYLDEIQKMLAQGHEIGCHGLTHGDEEDYDRMPEEIQRSYVEKATEELQALVDTPIRAFRSPRVKTSARTLKLLAENGYQVDSSVCSQRIDFISSNLINAGWLFSPRRPYHPHRDSPFRVGDVPIWEIPISAMILPFISSTMRVLGLSAMKMLFKLLYVESRCIGKPIVYLAHPSEFRPGREVSRNLYTKYIRYIKPEYFSPTFIRTHGFRFRNSFYRIDGEALLDSTRELFAYMASFPDVTFVTASEYARQNLEGQA